LEGRDLIEPPALRQAPLLDEALAEAELQLAALDPERRQEIAEEAEAVRHDVGDDAALGNGIAAVEPLPEGNAAAPGGGQRTVGERRRPYDRAEHLELRQADTEAAAKKARPGAAGEHRGTAGDAPLLGDDCGDATARRLDAAYGAAGENGGAEALCGI